MFLARLRSILIKAAIGILPAGALFSPLDRLAAQPPLKSQSPGTPLRIGERLTFNISFEAYNDVGFAETYVVSRGKLGESDAIELRLRIKTHGILSAAFYQIDESRTTFASPDTGLPLYVRRTDLAGVTPKESVSSFLAAPAVGLDLLTLLYRVRLNGGVGSFILFEGDRTYTVALITQSAEKVKTDAGDFDTSVSAVESEYLTDLGIRSLRINFSNDDARLPIMVRFRTPKGEFRIVLSGIHLAEPEIDTSPSPPPVQTPKPAATPRPTPSPTPYVDNLPLPSDLGFILGETLRYRISAGGRGLGEITLRAKERKQFKGEDSLVLAAEVTSAEQGNGVLALGDSIITHVDPATLSPRDLVIKLSGTLAFLNQTVDLDQKNGIATVSVANRIEIPVGTHDLVSLLYALRSFNLKPSKDMNNPVNDTRVAVIWQSKAYIFSLRPSELAALPDSADKTSAQKVTINTGIPALDQNGLSVWLSNDARRVPLRFTFGVYQADLVTSPQTSP